MEKLLFVYNPQAGTGTLKNKISDILEIFRREDFEVTVFPTLASEDAQRIVAERATEFDRIVCAGGDGTLHEVVHGLMQLDRADRPPVGYIPAGTVNDFANGIKLPRRPLKAAGVAVSDLCKPFDIGDMNHRIFSYVAAFGAFTSVSYETPQFSKNMFGKTAYLLDGMTKLNTIRGIWAKVETDTESFEESIILGMVTNADTIGGMKLYRKTEVALDDGLFDCIFMKEPKNPIELNLALAFLMTGEANDQVRVCHSSQVKITTEEPVAYTLDGEAGGEHREVLIRNHKQAITFFHGLKK